MAQERYKEGVCLDLHSSEHPVPSSSTANLPSSNLPLLTFSANMQLTRVYTFFMFLVSFGLFAHAKPVSNGLTVRDNLGKDLEARTYPATPSRMHPIDRMSGYLL